MGIEKEKSHLACDPYLGMRSLYDLDLFIPTLCEVNLSVAKWTQANKSKMNELQNACSCIMPNAIQISLSIRELIKSGYLFSAKILLRSLLERILVISVFQKKPEKIKKWLESKGTDNRPSYNEMLDYVDEFQRFHEAENIDIKSLMKEYIKDLHSVVHTDVFGLGQNTMKSPEGDIRYLSGADHNNPQFADEICLRTWTSMAMLLNRIMQVFLKYREKLRRYSLNLAVSCQRYALYSWRKVRVFVNR